MGLCYTGFVAFLFSPIVWIAFVELRMMKVIIHLESGNLLKERYYELKYTIYVFSNSWSSSPPPPPLLSSFIHFPYDTYVLSKNVLGTGLWVMNPKVIMDPPCPQGTHILISFFVLHFHLQLLVVAHHHEVSYMNISLEKGFGRT